MENKSKYKIFKIIKFIVLSTIIIYFLYLQMNMPLILVLIFESTLVIKLLPIKNFIEKTIINHYPQYKNLNKWTKKLIVFGFYIIFFMIIKFIIINLILTDLLNIPIENQINEFIAKNNVN